MKRRPPLPQRTRKKHGKAWSRHALETSLFCPRPRRHLLVNAVFARFCLPVGVLGAVVGFRAEPGVVEKHKRGGLHVRLFQRRTKSGMDASKANGSGSVKLVGTTAAVEAAVAVYAAAVYAAVAAVAVEAAAAAVVAVEAAAAAAVATTIEAAAAVDTAIETVAAVESATEAVYAAVAIVAVEIAAALSVFVLCDDVCRSHHASHRPDCLDCNV